MMEFSEKEKKQEPSTVILLPRWGCADDLKLAFGGVS